jgi:hypothetical protein
MRGIGLLLAGLATAHVGIASAGEPEPKGEARELDQEARSR